MRIGVAGGFDVDNYGDLLFPLIAEHELGLRLPEAEFRMWSPMGQVERLRLRGARAVEALGPSSPELQRHLAEHHDLFVVGGGDICHVHDGMYGPVYGIDRHAAEDLRPSGVFIDGLGQEEARCPVAWNAIGVPFDLTAGDATRVRQACERHAYVAVRGDRSRERLLSIGSEARVRIVPDTALALHRLWPSSVLEERRARLSGLGLWPRGSKPIVLHGSIVSVPEAQAITEALGAATSDDVPVVLVVIGPAMGDARFVAEAGGRLPSALQLPEASHIADIAAAIAGAGVYVGRSLHGAITAASYGVPFLLLDDPDLSKLGEFAELVERPDALVRGAEHLPEAIRRARARPRSASVSPAVLRSLLRRIGEHFDRLAALALRTRELRAGPS